MAETGSTISKQQRQASSKVQENTQNPSKFYNQFLYKIVIVSIFLLVLPFFPSQAPDFINQTLHTTSWEILQLIFVGIAVSYGLFSKRNDETEKDMHSSKFDNAQSYVSGLLQVSSVFDDETESPSSTYENKVQTWNSQYYRGAPPMVTVAPEDSVLDQEQKSTHTRVGEKTLFLPVRSLKSRVPYPDESSVRGVSLDRSSSNLSSKQFSRSSSTSRTGELGGSSTPPPPKIEENTVLRSPIPWRSRSGRLEMKDDMENPFYTLPPSMEESKSNNIESQTFSSQSFRNSVSKSNSPPKNLSPTPSLSSEFQSQNVEDLVRRKSFRKAKLPIPPPPPPPPFFHKSRLSSSTSSDIRDDIFPRKDLKRSVRSVPNKLSANSREDLKSNSKTGEGAERWTRTSSDGATMSKYVETRDEEMKRAAKGGGSNDDFVNVMEAKRLKDLETTFIKNRGYPEKIIRENPSFMANQTFPDFLEEEKKQNLVEDVLLETEDEDSETDDDGDDEFDELLGYENQVVTHNSASDGGPDVDKKADEFIAKFREQIRLQRIESVRKSTGHLQKNTIR
ncbi:YLP motif-containing protein 1-like [Heracleum sosnowskyi]|uniref:YLP motif-containing protein 1-like n=1 Tax=Heracleum sosnowskyi TaxID=360622 RepID=A0AAD8I400_9APIA|nr:YLP motif-containing protein 1-like [Heracleum sosnowskyi]